jgi:monoterpene epsilon-lactone hydrolase
VDVTLTNAGIPAIEPGDTMLASAGLRTCGQWWAGVRDPADPVVSPLYADLTGLPPATIFQGDRDLFLPDVMLLDQRIRESGGISSLVVARGGFHVYVGAPWVPEAKYALDRAAAVVAGTTLSDRRAEAPRGSHDACRSWISSTISFVAQCHRSCLSLSLAGGQHWPVF